MKSIQTILAIPLVLAAAVALAEDKTAPVSSDKPKMTAEARLAKLGGYVVYPGSQKGSIAFIDTQSAVDVASDFEEVFGYFRHQVPVKIELTKSAAAEPIILKKNAKANFAVVFVCDDKAPPTVIVPEEGYAVVNFSKYSAGMKLPLLYRRRLPTQIIRLWLKPWKNGL